MTIATDVRSDDAKDEVVVPKARDDVFYDLLLTLTEQGISLDADGIKVFRDVVDRTVGDFLVATLRKEGKDLWSNSTFREWTERNTREVGMVAFNMGGAHPSADVVRAAANDVIRRTHDEYCANLPSTIKNRGPVCSGYLHSQSIE